MSAIFAWPELIGSREIKEMKIVLVIPCFNEAKRLRIKEFIPTDTTKFLFVNDGSSDKTYDLLKTMERSNLQLLNLEKNVGKAEAVRKGMIEALERYPDADWIGFWDADLATPLNQAEFMLAYLGINERDYNAIFGSRVMRLGAFIHRSFLRHVLGRFFVTYSSFVLGSHAYDSQCGAKLFRKEIVKEVFLKPFISKWFFDMEVIQRLSERNYSVLECPLQVWHDVSGSKIHPIADGLKAFFEVIKIRKTYGKIKSLK